MSIHESISTSVDQLEAVKEVETGSLSMQIEPQAIVDIEHVAVENDPRKWSPLRKNITLALIAFASMVAGLAPGIQNPAVKEIETDLRATSSQFSLSISLFILIQGVMPLLWSSISEVKGRKFVYVITLGLFVIASIALALSKSIAMVIGFRSLQAAGSSSVISIGAATLADIYDPVERGTKMGIYIMAPLLGPALGPIFGGVLTTAFGWRAIFWFLTIFSATNLISFVFFFEDTFRRERSLTYQNALKQRGINANKAVSSTENKLTAKSSTQPNSSQVDLERNSSQVGVHIADNSVVGPAVNLSLIDVNPIKPIGLVLRRKNNSIILLSSGILFALSFTLSYTTSRTLSFRYNYNALKIGLVMLAFGSGCISGSFLGGKWSDIYLARLKAANRGVSTPEMRLKSTLIGVCALPVSIVAFGWLCEKRVHVSALCVFLFLCGFFSVWIYSSTLAYIVDANQGRSSSAVAANSAFRGILAFATTEMVVPLQGGVGDGWTYTIWMGLTLLGILCIFLVLWKGANWREEAEKKEANASESST